MGWLYLYLYTPPHLQTANTAFFLNALQSQLSETMAHKTIVYLTHSKNDDDDDDDGHHN